MGTKLHGRVSFVPAVGERRGPKPAENRSTGGSRSRLNGIRPKRGATWRSTASTFRRRLQVVAHTEVGDRLRIISARRASRAERRQYEEGT